MFILQVVEALEKHKVDYAVVGGFAVALHGAVRGTVDLDIVLKFSKASFVGAEKALRSLGLECRLPVSAGEVFDFREHYIRNKNLIDWSFFQPSRPSEVVDVIITHDLGKQKVKSFEFNGRRIRVLAVESLIKMKRESGRPQDLEDIKALESLKK